MILHRNHITSNERLADRCRRFLHDLWPGVSLALACCFFVAIYAPLELFFTNLNEFKFGFSALLPALLKLFGVGFAACLLGLILCRLLYHRLYDVVLCAGIACFLSAYMQGMFFAGNLPPLDGTRIDWNQYPTQNLQSIILWAVIWLGVVLAARFFHRRTMYRLIGGLSLFFTAVLLVTGLSVGIMNQGFASRPTPIMTSEDQFTMSTDQNLVIFVVDATDSQTFQQMMTSTNPEFAEILEDFTYYPDTVSAYPFTKYAIPHLLHGQWYENQEDYYTFAEKAMTQSPLLCSLQDQNYRMGIYEEEATFVAGDSLPYLENTQEFQFQITNQKQLAKEELKLVWFKYAPWPLKRFVRVDVERFSYLLEIPEGIAPFRWRNPEFYDALQQMPVETVPEKCFRFYHIEGAHVPFRYDRDVNVIENGTYEQNMECTMTVVAAYLEKLKDAGVYDNTAIVLLADHGYGNYQDVPLVGRCNPLLAIKGIDEHHPMATSQAPISYDDLQGMYQKLLEGTPGAEVFDVHEGDQRDRRILFYYHSWDSYMAEYLQTGHATDVDALVPTDVIYQRQGVLPGN